MSNSTNDPAKAVGDDYSDMWTDPPFSATNPIHRGLKEMEENLRCYICRDFMTAPVSVDPCQHTFCSLCVQNHAKQCLTGSRRRKMDCPFCRAEITGTDINQRLTRNPTVENLIKSFKGIRSHLKQALLLQYSQDVKSGSKATVQSSDPLIAAKAVLEEVTTIQQTLADENNGRRKRTRKNYAEASMEDNGGGDGDENFNPTVSLEEKGVGMMKPKDDNNRQRHYRKKLSKPMYSHLKLNQRKKLCRDFGLSDSGSSEELKERHERFVTRFNAYCDSLEAKSMAEVAREVEEDERERMKEKTKQESRARGASAADAIVMLKRNREQMGKSENVGANAVAQSGIKWFDDEMNENFARLIAEGRRRLNKKPRKSAADETDGKEKPASRETVEPRDTKDASNATVHSVSDGPALKPSVNLTSTASTTSSTTPNKNSTNSKPSSTQMAYDPQAIAGISNNSTSFSPNETINTPAIPKLFRPGSNMPSTISHKQSQEPFPGSARQDPLPRASEMASSSPKAMEANAREQPLSFSTNVEPRSVPTPSVADAEMKARHEAARAYALDDQNSDQTKTKKNNGKKRSPTNLLEAGVTKTRVVAAPVPAPAPAPTRRSGRSIVGQWHCQVCTFFNENRTWSTASCEMCHAKRSQQGQGACNEYVQEATVSL